jgi:arginyl-tRNA synthetase
MTSNHHETTMASMLTLQQVLYRMAEKAFVAMAIHDADPMVQLATKPEFGDYQINGCMKIAKQLKQNPRALADALLVQLKQDADFLAMVEVSEVAGPGFINCHLRAAYLAQGLLQREILPQWGCQVAQPKKIMVECSSPNLAKEMHVGHLRSTIIGDAVANLYRYVGHDVHLCNHVGDWGTQFGMLIAYMLSQPQQQGDSLDLSDLEAFYRAAKQRFDASPEFAEQARAFVVRLQAGDEAMLAYWRQFVDVSMSHCEATYRTLQVGLNRTHVRGESAYNDDLPVIVKTLEDQGLAVEANGAKVVFLPEFRTKDDEPMGVLVQKSDGGYLYTTTDLGAIRYRCGQGFEQVVYVVDARQSQHFQQLFRVADLAGFSGDMAMEHVGFGVMMGDDGTPFKTRDGGTVKLADLLIEAQRRAYDEIDRRNPTLSHEEKTVIAQAVGIGAVKYADLSKNRLSNYIFQWDQMLSFEGNTAPYLQYAYARMQSLLRRQAEQAVANLDAAHFDITEAEEKRLALIVLQFHEALNMAINGHNPHTLAAYLYQLATGFSRFYEHVPIFKDGLAASVIATRLRLVAMVSNRMKTGLDLLGIPLLDRM